MTREETKIIIRVMMGTYPNWKPQNIAETIDIWHMMLEDEDYKMVSMALKAYIKGNNSGFAPSVGQLMDYVYNMTNEGKMSGAEAWDMVYRAICNSGYSAREEFQKLPKAVQYAVGSPSQLIAWGNDEHFNAEVVRSTFLRMYDAELKKEKDFAKMPKEVKKLLKMVNKGSEREKLHALNSEPVVCVRIEQKEDAGEEVDVDELLKTMIERLSK